jgi:peroxiredoxin (alkyl hydroperoxide reductase subunit C)
MRYQQHTIQPFQAHAYHQHAFRLVSEKDLLGKWSVLFFYPADFTFVCPTELSDINDALKELEPLQVQIFSVSTDTHFTHKAWHDASDTIRQLRYPMIADPTGQLSRQFHVYDESTGLADRATFVLDPEGQVKLIEITADGVGRNAAELVRKIKAIQYVYAHPGQACPAKWTEGAKTLTPSIDLVGKI